METISRQREEQSQSLGWQRPQSPVLPASPKSPATSAPSLSKDSGESEANNSQKGTVFPTTKLEEKSYAGKKSGLNKRPVLDSESSAPTAPAEETTVDECQPMIIQKQVVKEKDDPNRNNLGLLFVDLDVSCSLKSRSTKISNQTTTKIEVKSWPAIWGCEPLFFIHQAKRRLYYSVDQNLSCVCMYVSARTRLHTNEWSHLEKT